MYKTNSSLDFNTNFILGYTFYVNYEEKKTKINISTFSIIL